MSNNRERKGRKSKTMAHAAIACLWVCVTFAGAWGGQTSSTVAPRTGGGVPRAAEKGSASLPAPALEIPSGVLFGKFEKENGPYLITGSVIVPSGEVLEFGPGCIIYMGGEYSTITVFGQIMARGTAAEPVVFRSAKARPNPWDWDRIYVRSRTRSTFDHCLIEHSNYGIVVENGSAAISNCRFEQNSLHGLVARNADVTVVSSVFSRGQVCAVLCEPGGVIQADSMILTGNSTGLAVADKGTVQMEGGDISHNATGVVAMKGSSVAIVGGRITTNTVGIMVQTAIPRRLTQMAYGNGHDVTIASASDMNLILRPPQPVKWVVLPQSPGIVVTPADFAPGVSAVRQPQQNESGFIGNVTTGFEAFDPHSTVDSLPQDHYPGEENLASYKDNVQPELQVFANGKRNGADVNLMLDLYGNSWTGVRRNNTSLSLNYSNQEVIVGDFYETNSETSVFSRKMTGLKYDGNFWEMGRGVDRVNVRLAFGQSEIPKECGGHELDLFNTLVDTGMSVRQQMTYEAALRFKPSFNSSITARGLIARDQAYQTFIGQLAVSDPKAPNLVQAQTGSLEGRLDFLGGKFSLNAELDIGASDTLVDTVASDSAKIAAIAWYDPQVPQAISRVFGVLPSQRNYAFTAGATGLIDGYKITVNGGQIAPSYFSAGNPYLEIDRRIASVAAQKDYSENLSASLDADYQRRMLSTSPLDNTTVRVNGKYGLGKFLPEFAFTYMFYYETSKEIQYVSVADSTFGSSDSMDVGSHDVDSGYTVNDFRNLLGIEAREQFANNIDYSLKYQMLLETDASKYVAAADENRRSGMQHQVTALFGFRIGKVLRNRTTARVTIKNEVLDSLNDASYKIGDELQLSLIPRKLMLNLKGEYSNRFDKRVIDTTSADLAAPGIHQDLLTLFDSFEAELKYVLTDRWSFILRGRYELSLDQTPGSRENYTAKIASFYLTYLF